MRYRYRIYHSEKDNHPVEQDLHPFSNEQQVREYSLLPDDLSRYLRGTGIAATCVPDEIELNGVIAELASNKSEDEIDSCLAKFLVKRNYDQVNGLCLVIDKLASK